jgi:GNAT superfamily N-acetyltransferase
MSAVRIEPITPDNALDLSRLVVALADYEKLSPPTPEALARLLQDVCAGMHIRGILAYADARPVGYALFFTTYSSFLARPTMYLEDIFVVPEARTHGVGNALFSYVRTCAEQIGCGRMEWQVLDWNMLAREFYERRGATAMAEWITYRINLTTTEEPAEETQ